MNQSVSRQGLMIGAAGAVALVLLAVLYMWRGEQATAPVEVVEAIYRHCQAGEIAQTGRYYDGGPAADAEMRANLCTKITQANSIKGWEIISKATADADAAVITHNLRDGDDGRTLKWMLIRKGGRWLVAEVV